MRIRWMEFEPQGYEDMVAVLLSRLHPDSQRIDGKGGDGGRDVQIADQDGQLIHAFELKSFTGRMTTKRRKQVIRSLKRVAGLKPPEWTLVVPIDPTPGEMNWFKKQRGNYDFPLAWFGETWLDEKMSAHPDIRQYFCEGASEEVVNLLLELNREEVKVIAVADAVGRLQTLRQRLNEIDPYYRYELSTGSGEEDSRNPGVVLSVTYGSTRVDVYEKYKGALKDRPITASVEIIVGPDEEALLEGVQSAFDYGLPVSIPSEAVKNFTLDAPAGLGGSFSGGELSIRSTPTLLDEPLTLALNFMEGNNLLASWPVHVAQKIGGNTGVILDASDETGWLEVQLKVNPSTQEFFATLKLTPRPIMPAALVPLLRWVSACRPPHRLTIVWPDGLEMSSEMDTALGDERFAAVVEALAYLQERSGVYFPMPLQLPANAEKVIVESAALLRDGRYDFTWGTVNLRLKRWAEELEPLLEGKELRVTVESDQWIDLEEGRIPIGRIRTHIESARAADPEGVQRAVAAGLVAEVQLVPGDSDIAQNLVVT